MPREKPSPPSWKPLGMYSTAGPTAAFTVACERRKGACSMTRSTQSFERRRRRRRTRDAGVAARKACGIVKPEPPTPWPPSSAACYRQRGSVSSLARGHTAEGGRGLEKRAPLLSLGKRREFQAEMTVSAPSASGGRRRRVVDARLATPRDPSTGARRPRTQQPTSTTAPPNPTSELFRNASTQSRPSRGELARSSQLGSCAERPERE